MSSSAGIPIVFFHKGDSWYLKYTLRQVKFSNPTSDIYLIGDASNSHYSYVRHVSYQQYEALTIPFKQAYEHRNSNEYDYELTCFLRWFYMLGLAEENKWEAFIYLDSDVLAFDDFSRHAPLLEEWDVANTGKGLGMPAFTYFKSRSILRSFCDYLYLNYTDTVLKERLSKWWEGFEAKTWGGGICDMTIFDFFFQEPFTRSGKLDKVGNIAVDASLSLSDGFEMEGAYKKIYWKNGLPHGKWLETGEFVRFVSLHYQGSAKGLMIHDYKGPGGIHWKDMLSHTFPKFTKTIYSLKRRIF